MPGARYGVGGVTQVRYRTYSYSFVKNTSVGRIFGENSSIISAGGGILGKDEQVLYRVLNVLLLLYYLNKVLCHTEEWYFSDFYGIFVSSEKLQHASF